MVARWWLIGVAVVAILLAVTVARPRPTPGPLLRDFEAYWSAGVAWDAGADPYGRAIWRAESAVEGVDARRDELLPFVAPPATLPLWGALARLPFATAAALWLACLVVALFALVGAAVRLARVPAAAISYGGALLLAASFGPVTSDLALGQLALPAFAGAICCVLLAEWSTLAAAVAALVAFAQPNAALGLVSQLGRNRATAAILIGALTALLVGAIALGWTWPPRYAKIVGAHGLAERFVAIQITPAAVAYGLGAGSTGAICVALACAIATIAAAVAIWHRVPERFARFAAFSALAPFVAGFFHEHDLVVTYPAVIWCALRTRNALHPVALAASMLVAIDWLGLAQRPTGTAQICLLAVAGASAFCALGETVGPQLLTAAASIGLLLGAAGVAAHAHPLPVWPDALGRFHASAHAGAATVWFEEQRANGLLAVSPVAAALRSLPLLGCALLAYLIYRRSGYRRTA
ncbi:MAG: hypothetical protein JO263_03360 [Candidatus Eremiobacteraeota bacterium]|nr:hypothetical protein [Candidatus Eremiobacteraeota bacterium]